jgi:hypothetical protein
MMLRKRLQPSACNSPGSTSGPEFDSPWERISHDLTAFVLSVVGDVPLDSECACVVSVSDVLCNSKKKNIDSCCFANETYGVIGRVHNPYPGLCSATYWCL